MIHKISIQLNTKKIKVETLSLAITSNVTFYINLFKLI